MFIFVTVINNQTINGIMKKENQYIAPPLGRIIRWWKEKSTPDTKGGGFNYELYLQYLNAISK